MREQGKTLRSERRNRPRLISARCLADAAEAVLVANSLFAFILIDKSVLLENRPLKKFIRNYVRDSRSVFSISSTVWNCCLYTICKMLSEKLMASVRFPNISKTDIKSFSEGQENVLTYISKYEKELNFVWRKIIQGVPSSVDERRQLQEISAAELQQFAITCVLGLWERKMVKTLVYIIKRKLQGALKIEIYFLVVKNNISLTQVKHLTPCRTTYLYLNYASIVKTPVS